MPANNGPNCASTRMFAVMLLSRRGFSALPSLQHKKRWPGSGSAVTTGPSCPYATVLGTFVTVPLLPGVYSNSHSVKMFSPGPSSERTAPPLRAVPKMVYWVALLSPLIPVTDHASAVFHAGVSPRPPPGCTQQLTPRAGEIRRAYSVDGGLPSPGVTDTSIELALGFASVGFRGGYASVQAVTASVLMLSYSPRVADT
ncbi:MAG: hypothetical protein BWY09_01019 [Candidatus Hydrogenedentes bacterium ADurb.Bin179]|nr:MAG: hypothetical protein BWY09_01019 [Candidatus Hydrogenedentes bacterium ADurb.Bin179]